MTPDKWKLVKEIFARAAELPAGERMSYLSEACAGDAELRAEVESLLSVAASATDAVAAPFSPQSLSDDQTLLPGTQVGEYTIIDLINSGGMGAVYRAQQHRPSRIVALKLIRPGLMTRSMLRRFEFEADVLARLDHPGIARVFEAGTADLGRGPQPFFAMELVEGLPLDKFLASSLPKQRVRIQLFHQICQAVQHAHGRGIVHRDLKPDNILVTEEGVPRILDFGVARATGADEQTAATMNTETGQIVGTVPYMSPEQVRGQVNEVDSATDVYALGVIGYEVLAGRMPYEVKQKSLLEAARVICEHEPSRLSSADRSLRGDVETIVQKALEKEKIRRYATAGELAADVKRFLDYEPISARPTSSWYQLRKFARRNRVLASGVAATFFVLVAGLVATAWQAKVARDQRDRAVLAEAVVKRRGEELEVVSNFQDRVLGQVDPTRAGILLAQDFKAKFGAALIKAGIPESERVEQVKAFSELLLRVNATDAAREVIDQALLRPALEAIDRQFRDLPAIDATLRQVIANRYQQLGMYDAAMPLQRRALETRRRVRGEEHPETLISINNMGALLQSQGKFADAERYYLEALEKQRHVLGEEDPATLSSLNNLGTVLQRQGKLAAAESYFRAALEKTRRVLGAEHPDTLSSISNLGALLRDQGKLTEAEPLFREALEKSRRMLGEEHPQTLKSIGNMGALLRVLGKLTEAEPYCREALAKRRRVLGEESPDTLVAINNMGALLRDQGKLCEAEPYFREVVEKSRRVLGNEHPNTIASIGNLGALLQEQGNLVDAEPYLRQAMEARRRVFGEEHPSTVVAINNMGSLRRSQGNLAEAEAYFREALAKSRIVLGKDHPTTLLLVQNTAVVLKAQGKRAEAEPLFREAIEAGSAKFGKYAAPTTQCAYALAELLDETNRSAEAVTLRREYDLPAPATQPSTMEPTTSPSSGSLRSKRADDAG